METKVAMMETGKLAYVPATCAVGDLIDIWEVRSGRSYKARVVEFPSWAN